MSKRSTTEATDAPPRRRFGLPRLVDVRIRSKLVLILIVPLVALLAISGIRLYDSASQAIAAGELTAMVKYNSAATDLVYALQFERKEAEIQAHKGTINLGESQEQIANFEEATETSIGLQTVYEAALGDITVTSPDLQADINRIERELDLLPALRDQVVSGEFHTRDLSPYTNAINALRGIYTYAAESTTDMEISRSLRISGLLAQHSEYSEQLRLTALDLNSSTVVGNHYRDIVRYGAGRMDTMRQITALSDDAVRAALFGGDGLATEEAQRAGTFETEALDAGKMGKLDVKHYDLLRSYDHRLDVSQEFTQRFGAQTVELAEAARDSVVQRVLVEITVLLVTVVVAVMLALVIARSMALSLRRLREGALEVAHVDLPRAVAMIRETENIGRRTAADLVDELGDPLRMDNQDEVGTVAGAFNDIHREAVRIAAEQAALRASVSQMFVNLARRSQNLVDRLIGHLDRLERGEEDPDRLAELFQLDHLATRMRRNDENLLVLAGADSTRVERSSAQIGDVLRAAQSEVEQYTRVEFGTVLADSEVEPGAINDIVHLIAELLDNATSFSPPDSAVIAEARQVGDEILVRITDRGIGISPAQLADLNDQLRHISDVDISASRMMGLVVVGRLAERHELNVTLQQGSGGRGTVAEVVLPAHLLTGGDANRNNFGPPADPVAAPPQRQALGGGTGNMFEPYSAGTAPDAGYASSSGFNGFASSNGTGGDDNATSVPGSQGVSFYPGDTGQGDLPRRKIMEVTGEIVADGPADTGAIALPMIRLDAAPLPGPAPEIPKPRGGDNDGPPSWPAGDSGAATAEPAARAGARVPAMDETMELPIFREVESAWFKASTPAPRPATDGESVDIGRGSETGGLTPPTTDTVEETVEAAPVATSSLGALPRRGGVGPAPEAPEVPEFDPMPSQVDSQSWRTAADRGWREAAEKTEQSAEETTTGGLPKRRPMERLVPGAVEAPESEQSANVARRNPEGVRGLLSAYHRGVQRGRGNETSMTTNLTNRAGKERNR
ncbi:ATP-binding protein [Stackebrandtia soli]|uniref:ATP-binding protein n=1 Tax=Stackebrandtia soli TaxID=1892856 RepID=UPI0039EAAE94